MFGRADARRTYGRFILCSVTAGSLFLMLVAVACGEGWRGGG